jgi:radical SAM superfamily enzyme YgiQ (UPF0313 family)
MKLGLIAMSGTRAQNAELMALGLTLPGFVERGKTVASLPSLGLLTLAGLTPPEIDIEYIEVRDLDALPAIPSGFDAVAISSFTAQIGQAYRLADAYRARGTHVVLGGLHVTALPDEAAAHADAIVLGEGEPAWPAVMRDLQARALQPRYDARAVSFDLADAPLPRFDLLDVSRYNRLTVQTQRGCPHRCEFCASSVRLSPRYKVKPVTKVIAEIRRIKELWPRPFIELADDNTFVNKRHSKELLRAIAAEGIRWFTETDISVADDAELLDLMRDSGCAQILIGLESPSRPALDGLEQRGNWKLKRRDRYAWAIERIHSRGITVNGCFVLGLDHTGPESFDAVCRFVRVLGLYEVQITILTPFPGTPLYERLRAEGRLLHDGAWERCTLFDVNFEPGSMSVSELETKFRQLAEVLYSAPETRARRRRFVHAYRARAPRGAHSGGGQWAAG